MKNTIDAEIWYLDHSGFAVKTSEHFLIFDYYNQKPVNKGRGLDAGVISPDEIKDLNVVVFASHAHGDHYIPDILAWEQSIPNIHYVLSDDIRKPDLKNATMTEPNREYEISGVRIRTLKSTDEGVAFIAETDGLKIYHAGDLNWWHWDGEPDEDNEAMAREYKKQMDAISGECFDIAFVPVDPRLENEYLWGLDQFMRCADAKMVFPMHFWRTFSIINKLYGDPMALEYKHKVKRILRRGERFEYIKETNS